MGCAAIACAALLGVALVLGETALAAQDAAPDKVDFAHEILPLLKARCASCHTNGKYKGSLSLDTREDLLKSKDVVPGQSAKSELVERLRSTEKETRMPREGEALSEKQIQRVAAWIDQGVAWEPGFSFKTGDYVAPLKPRRPTVPPERAGAKHPIDRFISQYDREHKLPEPEPADDAVFLRRAQLDLIGQLPTADEALAFVQDPDADKRTKLIERLLAENRPYADHWLTFWNDLLRNDYAGTGYIDGGRKQISKWLYQSLLDNKTYDQFVRELISPSPDSAGFIAGIQWRGNVNASQVREIQFSQNVSQVFFGVNMKCASCHDSFINAWKLNDAYSLAAVIADRPLEIARCDKPTGKLAAPAFLWPELGEIDAKLPPAQRLDQLAKLVTHPDNGRFTRTIVNRVWQRLMGRGLVQSVDIMGNRPWDDDLLDYLAVYLADNHYDLKKLIAHIATSRAYQGRCAAEPKELSSDYVFHGPAVQRLTAEQFVDAVWQITHTAPSHPDAPVELPTFGDGTPPERRYVRAALMKCDALMRTLGRPNREQVVTTRGDVLTTLQALDLSNGPEFSALLARGGQNLVKENGAPEPLVGTIYLRALGRQPTADERAIAVTVIGEKPSAESAADLLWMVLMLPEFQLIR